ncbi:hypothetical protein D3C81_1817030 [compost metagenome]
MAQLLGLMQQTTGRLGPHLARIREDQIAVALLQDDPAGGVARTGVRRKGRRQQVGPSILFDQVTGILSPGRLPPDFCALYEPVGRRRHLSDGLEMSGASPLRIPVDAARP